MSVQSPTNHRDRSVKRRGTGTALPEPSGGDFDPFMNAAVIGKLGTKASIIVLGPPELNQTEFSDMQMPVQYKGLKYSMGMKTSSGNYARLYAMFGKSEKKWRGKVNVEVKHFKNNDFVAIV